MEKPSKAPIAPRLVISTNTAWWIHFLLPLALVAIGYQFSGHGRLYLDSFAELFSTIATVVLLLAGVVDVSCNVLPSFLCRRLQAGKTGPKMRFEEAQETVRAAWMFASLAAWPRMYMKLGMKTAVVFTLAEAQPEAPESLSLYMVKLLLATLAVDCYMYFKHRSLHWGPMFAFHKGHHTFHDPSPFASFAVAPVEAFLTFWPVTLLSFPSLPVWAHAYGLWTAGFVLLNLYLHAGFESTALETLLRAVGLNSSAFHNRHHERTVSHFGELGYLWDYMLGTGRHPWDEEMASSSLHGKEATLPEDKPPVAAASGGRGRGTRVRANSRFGASGMRRAGKGQQ
jgi:sterol desaturase/sphingolipid hydroxylase (fatty acid hydroxylase superfamily)